MQRPTICAANSLRTTDPAIGTDEGVYTGISELPDDESLADNSIGIKDEFKATAFEPMLGSEGIGLDIVKNIIVAHGGSIRLEDNPGGGTIFFISLPVYPEVIILNDND
jgi:signal transduction histidine kinase